MTIGLVIFGMVVALFIGWLIATVWADGKVRRVSKAYFDAVHMVLDDDLVISQLNRKISRLEAELLATAKARGEQR